MDPEKNLFVCRGFKCQSPGSGLVCMTHLQTFAGYPADYKYSVAHRAYNSPPETDLFSLQWPQVMNVVSIASPRPLLIFGFSPTYVKITFKDLFF